MDDGAGKVTKAIIKNNQDYYSKTFKQLSMPEQAFESIEFEDCTFSDCDFTEATFKKCRFIECSFTQCNLSLIKTNQAQFTDVTFEDCKLIGVDWTHATWSQLRLAAALEFRSCVMNDSTFFDLNLDEIKLIE